MNTVLSKHLFNKRNYEIFKEYTKLIESQLVAFIEETKYSEEEVYLACSRIKDYDEQMLICLDYLLASTEYEEFYNLIMDFKVKFYFYF